jgi:hypothetical protein
MKDRELFEMAAKAIGIRIKLTKSKVEEGKLFCLRINGGETKPWNPLDHDGDALRLAVQLKIDVKHYDYYVVGWFDRGYIGTGKIAYGDDPYAATRRAITRAAAEIGKTMENQNV